MRVKQALVESARAVNGSSPAAAPLLSIVIPAHDEAGVVGSTLRRIAALAEPGSELAGRIEIVAISDGSTDGTYEEVCDALGPELPGKVVELVANAGSHAAMRCGLRHASGENVAIMAADGQDPPEALPAMLRALRPSVDVVWGRRRDRANDRAGARRAAAAYYRLFRLLTGLDYPPSGLDFLVARRRVMEAALEHSGRNTSLFLVIYNLGFAQAFADYDRAARAGGRSSWTLRKRLKLAMDMLTSFSAAPIRVAALVGMVVGLAGIVLGGVTLLRAAVGDVPVPGWASLMVVSSITSGCLLVAVGFVGEYVWRILDEVRGAPTFLEGRLERVPPAAPPVHAGARNGALAIAVERDARPAAGDRRPGLDPRRLTRLMQAAIVDLDLDLSQRVVVTEAATGAYGVTPVLAALAGAERVRALARDSRFGSADEVVAHTRSLAAAAGVEGRIEVVLSKPAAGLADADIVTNSGHLRPLDEATVEQMKPGAAIPLMYEAWELRPGEVDLEACARRGIRVAGTNERHPAVDVFSFLGPMAVRLLTDAGVAVHASTLLVLCDNPFRSSIAQGLAAAGAAVEVRANLPDRVADPRWDAVLVALQPRGRPVLGAREAIQLAERAPGAVVAQLWGDLDRDALDAAGVPVWPEVAPAPGHMGILPSALGPEPIVRLQAAGLKVGELLCRDAAGRRRSDLDLVQAV